MQLLNTQQVAAALGVSYNSVVNYTQMEDNPLKVKVGSKGLHTLRQYDPKDVKEFAEAHGLPCDLPKA